MRVPHPLLVVSQHPLDLAVANPEHEKILKRGSGTWDYWRIQNPLVRPDLKGYLLQHSLRFDMRNTFELMDSAGGPEEQRARYEALRNRSIYYDPDFQDCWNIENLRGINFENVDLTDAMLAFADLSGANLRNANLQGANLQETVLKDVDLTNSNLEDAVLRNTMFANTNLTLAKGLLSCRHMGRSPVDHATVHKSTNLPDDFLLGCVLTTLQIRAAELSKPGIEGTEVAEIAERIRKLADQPFQYIQYTSCFISYANEDTDFATKLHGDLR